MIDLEKFLEKYYSDAVESKREGARKFITLLNNKYPKLEPGEIVEDFTLMCEIFKMKSTSIISRASYQKIKSYLVNLAAFCGKSNTHIPTRDEVIAHSNISFYSSLDNLLDTIDYIGDRAYRYYQPEDDLLRIKAVCILIWLGYSLDDLTKIKGDDLFLVEMDCLRLRFGGKEFFLKDRLFTVIYGVNVQSQYRTSLDQTRHLVDDGYLFKQQKEDGCGREVLIASIIKAYNALIPSFKPNIKISIKSLRRNALFVEVYEKYDLAGQDIVDGISKVFGCVKPAAYDYISEYSVFKQSIRK